MPIVQPHNPIFSMTPQGAEFAPTSRLMANAAALCVPCLETAGASHQLRRSEESDVTHRLDPLQRIGYRRIGRRSSRSKSVTAQRQLLCLIPLMLLLGSCECRHAICFEEPTQVERIELRDGKNSLLWQLVRDGAYPLTNADYGVVPRGYRQTYPPHGQPRALRPGEPILLLWKSRSKFTRHWGAVAEGDVIHYGFWSSAPVAGRSDAQMFVDEPRTIDTAHGYPR